jgi:hypothetical protein
MYSFIVMAHSGWRYIVLLVLAIAIIKYLIGWLGNGKWASFDVTLNRFTPIVIDVQWLLGIIIWIMGSWWANSDARVAWEHPFTMTLALAAGHVTAVYVRRAADDRRKFMIGALGYLLTGVLIAIGVITVVGGLFGSRV